MVSVKHSHHGTGRQTWYSRLGSRVLMMFGCSCKPACAWSTVLSKSTNSRYANISLPSRVTEYLKFTANDRASGYVQVCDKNDQVLSQSQGNSEQSSCASSNAGNAFLCSHYSPEPQTEDFSYGFAITDGSENCCKCFELTWTDGPARDKRMQVQVINEGGSTDNGRDFIILMPGGGVGPTAKGCQAQFGISP